jgi:hypothetical protein
MFISLVFAPRFWTDYISFPGPWVKVCLNKLVVPPLHIGGTPRDPREPDYLATFTFERKVSSTARVSLGQSLYSLGRKLIREQKVETVLARLDARQGEWVFLTMDGEELVRRKPKDLEVHALTGLDPSDVSVSQPVQLTFPCFV